MSAHCRGCGVPVFWAKYEKPPHKPAPLVRPDEGQPGNVEVFTMPIEDDVSYRIVKPGEGEFVSHFSNCPKRGQFRPPKGDTP